jgi:ATP-binding cassette, subfamily B, bacterial HlyB/CyaB
VSTETDGARPADPGLEALVTLLHVQGVAADRGQLRHRLGTDKIGAAEMLRCAKDLGLKARAYRTRLVAACQDAPARYRGAA